MLTLGRSQADITPPVGIPLGGWPVERPSERVHRPLSCRVLVLRQDDEEVVLVTLDLLGTSTVLAAGVREAVAEVTGVATDRVLLASSHTHSGPVMPPCLMRGVSPPDEAYLGQLRERVVDAVQQARGEYLAVRVGAGLGHCDLGVSRRRLDADGRAYWPPRADPDLEIDRTVGVVRFEDEDGGTPAVLFSYGCHPTVAGPSRDIGPDYPGPAREVVERAFPGAQAYFLLGNAADVRPNFTHPDGTFRWDAPVELVDDAGHRLGDEAVRVAEDIRAVRSEGLASGFATDQVVTASGQQVHPCAFHAVRLGAIDIVTNPAETFSELGLALRDRWPRPLMFASLTNGFIGYVPTKSAYAAGGYEVERAYPHFGLDTPFREDSAEVFVTGMHAALAELPGADA